MLINESPVVLTVQVAVGDQRTQLVNTEYYYQDIDMMEISNDGLAYKIANIAREELEKIKKLKFLEENPELNISMSIDEITASTPL